MSFTIIDWFLWIVSNICSCILLFLLHKGHARRDISFFRVYVLFELVQSIVFGSMVLGIVHHVFALLWYRRIYLAFLIPEYVLQLGILYQLYDRLLKSHKVLPERAFYVFLSGCVLILIICAIITLQKPASLSTHVASIFVDFSRSINLMQCAGYFFVVAFSSSLGLPDRHFIVGIALGMGIYRLGELVLAALVAQWDVYVYHYIRYLPDLTYVCSTLIWIDYFRREQSATFALHPSMLALLQRIQQQTDRFFPRRRSDTAFSRKDT